jgi:predicted Rossmann fold nucleotide-binding protein DprA/Smf involved in DNA uptake
MRNAVMAGMTAATVIIEASAASGTRIQARMSLASGRKVLLLQALLEQPWARELAAQPGVEVFDSPAELRKLIQTAVGVDGPFARRAA